ncbi:MAG: hypothetical protein SOI38_01895 [Eggerthellaceae bacterium]|jgi:putative membrane protein
MIERKRTQSVPEKVGYALSAAALVSMVAMPCYLSSVQPAVAATSNDGTQPKATTNQANNAQTASEKDETVFLFAKPDGSVKSSQVSAKLANPDKAADLADSSTLTNIKNVESTNSFTGSGTNMVWDAAGDDVYYQGDTQKASPIQVKITYLLDDKEVQASDLLGKSGKFTIRYEFTNDSYTMANIKGTDQKIYTPFVCMTGMLFDNDSARNVTVDNGKAVDDGDRTMVMGLAMPGLKDSLGLTDDDDVDIPSSFEVTADVTNFEMNSTITIATPNALDNVDTSSVDTSDIQDKLDQVQDAMAQLIDGSDELEAGLEQLNDGAGQLDSGAGELLSGAGELDSGAGQLADGASTLSSGAGQLSDGANTLAAGAGSLASGAATLQEKTATLPDSVSQLADGSNQVNDGLNQLRNGTSSSTGLIDALNAVGVGSDSTDTLYGGTMTLREGILLMRGKPTDTQGSLYAAKNGAGQLKQGAADMKAGANALSAGAKSAIDAIGPETDTRPSTLNGALNIANAQLTQVGDVKSALETLQSAQKTLETLASDSANASAKISQLEGTLAPVQSQLKQLQSGLATAKAASDQAASQAGSAKTDAGTAAQEIATSQYGNVSSALSTLNGIDTSTLTSEQAAALESAKSSLSAVSTSQLGDAATHAQSAATEAGTAEAYAQGVSSGLEQAQTGIDSAVGSMDELMALLSQEKSEFDTTAAQLTNDANQLKSLNFDADVSLATVQQCIAGVQQGLATMKGTPTDRQGSLYAAKNGADALAAGADQLGAGAGAVQDGLGTAIGAIDNQLVPGFDSLKMGLVSLANGGTSPDGRSNSGLKGAVDALGTSSTSGTLLYGTNALANGLGQLNAAAPQLADGVGQVADGAAQVSDGSDQIASNMFTLYTGAIELTDGAFTLKDGTGTLLSGTQTLKDGTSQLADGTQSALDGSQQLSDGLKEFNEEAIQQIVDAFDGNLGELSDRVDAIVDAGKDYQNFSGITDGTKGSVKFVIETDAVKND